MLKSISKFEVEIGERKFSLLCESEATWGEVHDALVKLKLFVIQKMQELEQEPKQEDNTHG